MNPRLFLAAYLVMNITAQILNSDDHIDLAASLPGAGLAEHPFLYAGEWDHRHEDQTLFIIREGKVDWTYTIPIKSDRGTIQEYSDATMLSNGSVLFAYMTGAMLVSPEKTTLWNYVAPVGFEVHVAQPIGTARVMIVQNGDPATMKLINIVSGELEKEIVLPTGNPARQHGHFRRARLTDAGTLLATHLDNNKIAEYDMEGNEVWALAVLSPWGAIRLKNGNTLVTSNRGFVREYGAAGSVIWEFVHADAPQYQLFGPQEAIRLASGNTVITYWCPGSLKDPKDWTGTIQVIEVTPEKEIVWALSAWGDPVDLGPATCIQLLDEPGKAEDGDLQR